MGVQKMNNKVGRPLKFKTVKLLETAIEEYFKGCWEEVWYEKAKHDDSGKPILDAKKKKVMEWVQEFDRVGNAVLKMVRPYTITGLAVALNTSRRTLLDYEEKPEYSHAIKKAKDICENFAEEGMFKGTIPAIPGIFNLKNNYGWRDKTEVEHSGEIEGSRIYNIINQVQRDFQKSRGAPVALDRGDGLDEGRTRQGESVQKVSGEATH